MNRTAGEGGVETFIVRIYRRDVTAVEEPVGTVECVASGERQGFAGRDELLDRLFLAGTHAPDREPPHGSTETQG